MDTGDCEPEKPNDTDQTTAFLAPLELYWTEGKLLAGEDVGERVQARRLMWGTEARRGKQT